MATACGEVGIGSIPACTGEPSRALSAKLDSGVYPRVYGGTSPRTSFRAVPDRSIPACTGEPNTVHLSPPDSWVYPRVYGGTIDGSLHRHHRCGLSPRVRGNLSNCRRALDGPGSIPACTGEPTACTKSVWRYEVYPRVYGGTSERNFRNPQYRGLSPRVRGNPRAERQRSVGYGSIPACTGEPPEQSLHLQVDGVYPRVYGGTGTQNLDTPYATGLSPRVRGNPGDQACERKITGVYPRVYGGTSETGIR